MKKIVVGPFDKDFLEKEAAINKLSRTTFEQAMMIKELESEIKVL